MPMVESPKGGEESEEAERAKSMAFMRMIFQDLPQQANGFGRSGLFPPVPVPLPRIDLRSVCGAFLPSFFIFGQLVKQCVHL